MITEEAVLEALKVIIDPDLRKDIVTLGFIQNLTIDFANLRQGRTLAFTQRDLIGDLIKITRGAAAFAVQPAHDEVDFLERAKNFLNLLPEFVKPSCCFRV